MTHRHLVVLTAFLLAGSALAQQPEWPGFRGPGRDGVAPDATPPLEWSDGENVSWKTELPGPGASSPVVLGDRVYVTCFTGYGLDREEPGDPKDLRHHVVCVARDDGKIVWSREVPGNMAEKARQVEINEHGFASPTPVTDGEKLYVYFGKVGIVALDLEGEIVWQQSLGTIEREAGEDPLGDDRPRMPDGRPIPLRWGAGSSPLLFDDLIIVNASEESDSIRALDRHTGELVWKRFYPRLEGSSISPIVAGAAGEEVLVIVLAGEVWGMDPHTGDELWQVETDMATGMVPTPVADESRVYAYGGSGKACAIRFARDAVADDAEPASRIVWTSKNLDLPSPILHDGTLFQIDQRGIAVCLDAKTGEVQFNSRLEGRTGTIYASPVLADGRLYVTSRENGIYVYSADGKYELLEHNQFESDASRFDASPAMVGEQMFVRSQKYLYCLADS